MSKIVLFEDHEFTRLLPLTYWRTVFGLRCGRKTLLDRIALNLQCSIHGLWTREWISAVAAERYMVPVNEPVDQDTILVNGRWLISNSVQFQKGSFIGTCDDQIAFIVCDQELAQRIRPEDLLDSQKCRALIESVDHAAVDATLVRYPWDLVANNEDMLRADWQADDRGVEGKVSSLAAMVEPDQIYIGLGAVVEPTAVIDAEPGPVYIAQNARIKAHSYIQGPAYIGPGSVVNPHCQVHGGTTIGPMCKVGGELDGTIIAGYSNKQHGGFLGHAYIGSWVNLGAGTVNSDLKNTYGSVRAMQNGQDIDTGTMFYGAVIADHAKLGIRQTITTGSSIGFAANLASSHILPKFVPSFSWLTDDGMALGDSDRLLSTAVKMMQRRDVTCASAEKDLFHEIARRMQLYEKSMTV